MKGQAYAVHLSSRLILGAIGVWERILPGIETFRQVKLSDADRPGVVEFQPTDLGTEVIGYVAEHQALLTPLQEFLQECPNVEYLCPVEVVQTQFRSHGVDITLNAAGESRQICTRLLVAADGARSRIRQNAGIKTWGWQYWQSCIVAVVKPEKPHNNTAYEKFWSSGPFAILPLPGNRCRIVWTAPHAEAKALLALDEAQFLAELTRRYGTQMGRLQLEGDRFMFPVQLMQSDRYVLPRLALVGDAAHCCHPVGGQGLNLGIRDAAALAEVLQTAHHQGEDLGSLSVLKRYERWRKRENSVVLGFTDLLDRTFSNNYLPVAIARQFGLWILRRVPPVKRYALQLMTGLRGRLPELAQK
jgi:2-octaprenyl-6-methoxyphenol hydroxylase